MSANKLKGTLLEYLIRQLLINCGFTPSVPDGHYVYQQKGKGLFFVNGKGAAHDADVLMDPPIQLPFSYPSRILFECKAYKHKVGLNVIRNVLGLRYDINEFEIITDDTVKKRKNNKRAFYAISNRIRYNYQVGVASLSKFSSPAFEFAANNKIPLISLNWFLPDSICDLFHEIDDDYMLAASFRISFDRLFKFLHDKKNLGTYNNYNDVREFVEKDELIGKIIRSFESIIDRVFIGLLESGDIIFLFSQGQLDHYFFSHNANAVIHKAKIHWNRENPFEWRLSLQDQYDDLIFYLPKRLIEIWAKENFNKTKALDVKEQFFSRMYIFFRPSEINRLPFAIVNLDNEWLQDLRITNEYV